MFEENGTPIQENIAHKEGGLSAYVAKVFGWMFGGLVVTAITAFTVFYTGMFWLFLNPIAMIALVIAEFALVIYLSRAVAKDTPPSRAGIAFMTYAIINGLTLSIIFIAYGIGLIYQAFFVTAITFGMMAVYGYVTKKDLTRIGTILLMALLGVIIATLVNMVMGILGLMSTTFDLIISYITVIIFLGLTAWDTQKIKAYYYHAQGNEAVENKLAIVGALALYLDFINLFLTILRIFGRSRK